MHCSQSDSVRPCARLLERVFSSFLLLACRSSPFAFFLFSRPVSSFRILTRPFSSIVVLSHPFSTILPFSSFLGLLHPFEHCRCFWFCFSFYFHSQHDLSSLFCACFFFPSAPFCSFVIALTFATVRGYEDVDNATKLGLAQKKDRTDAALAEERVRGARLTVLL